MAPGGRHRRDSGKGKSSETEKAGPATENAAKSAACAADPSQLSPTAQSAAEGTRESPHSTEEITCVAPTGCIIGEPIDPEFPEDAVRVICSNNECTEGSFMHLICFEAWENHLLNLLKNSGRARNWNEKQRLQNLWSKRGYDITYRACECSCGHGHLKKDLGYAPPIKTDDAIDAVRQHTKAQRRRKNSKQLPVLGRPSPNAGSGQCCVGSPGGGCYPQSAFIAPRMRSRTLSLGSAAGLHFGGNSRLRWRMSATATTNHCATEVMTCEGFSQALSQSPTTENGLPHSYGSGASGHWTKRERQRSEGATDNDYFGDEQVRTTGSIFKRRDSLSSFYKVLPKWKVNGFHIKMEDDCPQGNDDTRIFLLTTLGDHKMRDAPCLLCNSKMQIYDKYPLIDGTFFLSPVNLGNVGLPVRHDGRDSFLLALCMECLETGGSRLMCLRCGQRGWFLGDRLLLGSLYTYDIISSSPCCPPECRFCHSSLPLPNPMLDQQRHFSAFSEPSNCPQCSKRDHHYVRRIDTLKLLDMGQDVANSVHPAQALMAC